MPSAFAACDLNVVLVVLHANLEFRAFSAGTAIFAKVCPGFCCV